MAAMLNDEWVLGTGGSAKLREQWRDRILVCTQVSQRCICTTQSCVDQGFQIRFVAPEAGACGGKALCPRLLLGDEQ